MNTPNLSVLVVDDEEDICLNLSDILTDLGYHVEVAHDGPSALERVRRRHYDIAILDLKMPGMDGLSLYREIRKLRPETVAIVVSAYAAPETAAQALDAGAWRVLPKPIDPPRLLGLLEEAAGQPLILVVDDDADLCVNLWDLLRQRGFRVSVAHDAPEAVMRLGERVFRIVLIDMKLPSGDGIDVFRTVRASNPQTRTVVITGFPSETDTLVGQLLKGRLQGLHRHAPLLGGAR